MAEGGYRAPFSIESEAARWKHVGGGTDASGNTIGMPVYLQQAILVDGIARRYGVLPSAVLEEDSRVMQIMALVQQVTPNG
jgi:hypothetical protein